MDKTNMPYSQNLILRKKFLVSLFILTFFPVLISAQNLSSQSEQLKSTGGIVVFAGEHHFKESDSVEGIHKGTITVRGPGNFGVFTRRIKSVNPGVGLRYSSSGEMFRHANMGNQDLLKGADGNFHWYPPNMPEFYQPYIKRADSVPEPTDDNPTLSLDVYATVHGGGIKDDERAIEYEFWFFPLEGGEIVSVIQIDEAGNQVEVTPNPNGTEDAEQECEGVYHKGLKKYVIGELGAGVLQVCSDVKSSEYDSIPPVQITRADGRPEFDFYEASAGTVVSGVLRSAQDPNDRGTEREESDSIPYQQFLSTGPGSAEIVLRPLDGESEPVHLYIKSFTNFTLDVQHDLKVIDGRYQVTYVISVTTSPTAASLKGKAGIDDTQLKTIPIYTMEKYLSWPKRRQ